jgi:hypothetical protein
MQSNESGIPLSGFDVMAFSGCAPATTLEAVRATLDEARLADTLCGLPVAAAPAALGDAA